jgi:branched-chain amino acid transport system ATP-binding protein
MVHEVMAQIEKIRESGVTILIVEQNIHHTLRFADRGYVLENGRVVLEGTAAALRDTDEIRRAYLGL